MIYLKQATLWAVGMVIINAKRSSINVLNALYINARLQIGRLKSTRKAVLQLAKPEISWIRIQ